MPRGGGGGGGCCPGSLASGQTCSPKPAVQGEGQASLGLRFDGAQVLVLYMSLTLFWGATTALVISASLNPKVVTPSAAFQPRVDWVQE